MIKRLFARLPALGLLLLGLSMGSAGASDVEVPTPEMSDVEPDVAQAIEQARQAVVDSPRSAKDWGHYGAVLHAHKFLDEAEQAYEVARAIQPRAFRWTYFHAVAREAGGATPEESAALFAEAARLRSDYAPVHLRLGLAESKRGRFDEARAALERALALDPALAVAHRSLGEVLLAQDDAEAAVKHLEAAAELAPRDRVVHSTLARAYHQLGRAEAARAEAELVRTLEPRDGIPDPALERGVFKLSVAARNRFSRAEKAIAAGEYAEALAEVEEILEVLPEDPDVWYLRGQAHEGLRDTDTAIEDLSRAIRLKADHARALLALGRILEVQARVEEAIELYRRCHEALPRDPAPLVRLSQAQIRLGDLDGLIATYRKLAELLPEEARVQLNLGAALSRKGEPAEALTCFEQAVRLDPASADAHYRLGVAYDYFGRRNEAERQYREALSLDPTHAGADEGLRGLETR